MRHGWTMAPAGLVLVLALFAAGSDNPSSEVPGLDGHFGSRISPILLLDRPDVQVDLQLEARQIAEARAAIARLMKRVRSLRGKKGPDVREEHGTSTKTRSNGFGTT